MKPADDSRGVGGAQFHITRWALVMFSAQSQAEGAETALAESAGNRYRHEPADYLTVEKIPDARWAMILLDQVMTQWHNVYAAQGKASQLKVLKICLRVGESSGSPSYEEVAKALGIGVGAVKTVIHRLRKRYSAILREEVDRTVSDPAEIDGEFNALCDALIAAEGRIVP